MDKVTQKVVWKLREELVNLAEAGMRLPKRDPFEHGVQVGTWQGIDLALQTIDSILADNEEDDSRL